MARDNSYSRLVVALKIALPMLALALLSTLFLFSRGVDPSGAITYAELDVEELAREPQISNPEYAGLTADGATLKVQADRARTDPMHPDLLSGEQVEAMLETPDGNRTDITANSGILDGAGGHLILEGNVQIVTATGYDVRSERLMAALDQTRLESPGAVEATSPMGQLTAGRMVLEQARAGGDYVLVFNNGVRLIYEP